jgi:3',5'-nucleoside bisphosphate phosphatase
LKIDLHIHSSNGSDGNLTIEEIFKEAKKRNIGCLSITDHDSIEYQSKAIALSKENGILYISGVELNVTLISSNGKSTSLDFLGYNFNVNNRDLIDVLNIMKGHREQRARQIIDKLNSEFAKDNIEQFSAIDLKNIEDTVDGTFGRPHIANYLVKKGIVNNKQEAFDKYLVKCDVPKYPLSLSDASYLIRNANGKLILAHPDDYNGTSLRSLTTNLEEQGQIIKENILKYIDGIECWHSRHEVNTINYYIGLARINNLIMTGGSDCHQKPIIMGTLDIPYSLCEQFIN